MNTMNYQLLGRSGLSISDFCPGTMAFGDDWDWGTPEDDPKKSTTPSGKQLDTSSTRRTFSKALKLPSRRSKSAGWTTSVPCRWDLLAISWLAWWEVPCSAACAIGSKPECHNAMNRVKEL